MTSLDLLAVVLAALGHDVGHRALTNRFLVTNRDALALKYNDRSVLENMHCSITFSIMKTPECDLLRSLCLNDWTTIRKLIIEMILDTDMSKHFEVISIFKTRALVLSDLNLSDIDDKCTVLAMGLKCADIGHSAKDTPLHVRWSQLLAEEFYAQGDLEKSRKQTVSMYCDRNNTDLPKSQAGFLKNISLPLHENWCKYLDSDFINSTALVLLKLNILYWENMIKKRKCTYIVQTVNDSNQNELKRTQSEINKIAK